MRTWVPLATSSQDMFCSSKGENAKVPPMLLQIQWSIAFVAPLLPGHPEVQQQPAQIFNSGYVVQ